MIIGFSIWSIVAAVFFGIGISCLRSTEAVGFFTFVNPPEIKDVAHYNKAVSVLWLTAAAVFEIIGIPVLFLEQNSPFFVLVIFAVMILLIGMMITYLKIEAKYRK